MDERECIHCGCYFIPPKPFYWQCQACWIKIGREQWKRKQGNGETRSSSSPTVQSMSRRDLLWVIFLTHPDHHPEERKALANRVTAMLNTIRASLKE